ncbi:MAG: hypothetical protein HZA93_17685 [Verrucomicrobia bacterium]|nr:hypothetical protein [Verrucomicrobiota bacterium]
MTLKPQSTKVTLPSLTAPSWGELADDGQPVSVVVFECGETVYSYPYHTLARWVLTPGAVDLLRIQAGKDEINIHGRNLTLISQALGHARLRVLRATPERYAEATNMIFVSRISVEPNV